MSDILVLLKITGTVVALTVAMFALFIFPDPIEAWFDAPASRAYIFVLVVFGYAFYRKLLDRISMLEEQNKQVNIEIRASNALIVRLGREIEKKSTKRSNTDQ